MLGKLLKHEFRATARVMLPVILALLVVSVMANFGIRYSDRSGSGSSGAVLDVLSTLSIVLFAVGIVAVIIVAVVLMVQRFRQNLLGDEGYVMHTLPVSVHSLLWSKLIVSAVWYLATIAAIFLAAMSAAMNIELLKEIGQFFKKFLDMFSLDSTTMALEIAVLFFLGCIASCLLFYASLATGHGFANRKMLFSIVALFGFSIVLEIAAGLISKCFNELGWQLPFYDRIDPMAPNSFTLKFHLDFGYAALALVIYSAIFYVITVFNLKKRLNLE